METKRFIGSDMSRLYDRVREEFGPDATIVRTRTLEREGAVPLIELIAAGPQPEQELSLDLQWTMIDGALGRLQIARPRATIGDLEEMVAAEAAAIPRLPAPAPEPRAEPPEWLEGYVDAAPASPASGSAAFEPVRRRSFASAEDIVTVEPPSPGWASRPRRGAPVPAPHAAARPEPAQAPREDGWDVPAPPPGRRPDSSRPHARRPRALTGQESVLISAGLSEEAARIVFAAAAPGADARSALAGYIESCQALYPADGVTALITVQGAPGSGRTTALIRMALDCADTGRETVLIAADTTRAAAREMLHAYAEATGLAVLDAMSGDGLAGALRKVPQGACAFVDSPSGGFDSRSLAGVVNYSFVALPATWQPAVLETALGGCDLGAMAGGIPTFVDLVTCLSPILSLAIEAGLPLAFLSSGRDVSSGVQVVDPIAIASGVLSMVTRGTTDGRLVASA
ncbi:MAG: hypothetical protein ACKVT1_09840 [Dehalococcoidia bacterium]